MYVWFHWFVRIDYGFVGFVVDVVGFVVVAACIDVDNVNVRLVGVVVRLRAVFVFVCEMVNRWCVVG